jgi:hypothetical protein
MVVKMSSEKTQIEFFGNTTEYDLVDLNEKYELGLREATLKQCLYGEQELTLTFRLGDKIRKPNYLQSYRIKEHVIYNEFEGLYGLDLDIAQVEYFIKRSYKNSPATRICKIPERIISQVLHRLKELKKLKIM